MVSLGGAHVTANQMRRRFEEEGTFVGLSTIYRQLEKLAADGLIRKYAASGGEGACYQYAGGAADCGGHFHLVCEGCGVLIHLDCDLLAGLERHLLDSHDFQINMLKTVFYGKCEKCRGHRQP
jgi:Fur family ferric uptake transcriptional regulator